MIDFRGCFVAMVTPFDDQGKINEKALRNHVEFLIQNKASGIVPCGTTGESATLSWDEHNHVVDVVLEVVNGKLPVIAGAGSNNTTESIAAAKHAADMKADAILCITPYYNKPTQEGLYQHYKLIAEKVDIPIVVYNCPGRTGVNILPETLERLCQFENIAAVKEASGNIGQISEIHRRCGDRLAILSGDDALTLPILSVGGIGVISVVGNLVPNKMHAMIESFLNQDFDRALKIHEELLLLSNAMFIETNPIPVKTAMNYLGMEAGSLRLPLVAMNERNKEQLISVLKKYNFPSRGE